MNGFAIAAVVLYSVLFLVNLGADLIVTTLKTMRDDPLVGRASTAFVTLIDIVVYGTLITFAVLVGVLSGDGYVFWGLWVLLGYAVWKIVSMFVLVIRRIANGTIDSVTKLVLSLSFMLVHGLAFVLAVWGGTLA